jgi:hypothetical protein
MVSHLKTSFDRCQRNDTTKKELPFLWYYLPNAPVVNVMKFQQLSSDLNRFIGGGRSGAYGLTLPSYLIIIFTIRVKYTRRYIPYRFSGSVEIHIE